MPPIAQQVADMVSLLPDDDQALAYEIVKKLVLAWDPDFTKLTPGERAELEQAEAEYAKGETVPHSAINWD